MSLDLRAIGTAISDYFIVCNADSTTNVNAIADNVEDRMIEKCGRKVLRSQGKENSFWIILDYGDIVVHIFQIFLWFLLLSYLFCALCIPLLSMLQIKMVVVLYCLLLYDVVFLTFCLSSYFSYIIPYFGIDFKLYFYCLYIYLYLLRCYLSNYVNML